MCTAQAGRSLTNMILTGSTSRSGDPDLIHVGDTGSHVFTTRTDRLISIVASVALVIAIPLSIVLSRWLRTVVEPRNHPA